MRATTYSYCSKKKKIIVQWRFYIMEPKGHHGYTVLFSTLITPILGEVPKEGKKKERK